MSEQQTKDQIAAVMLLHGTAEQQKSAIEYCSTPIAQPAPQGVAEVSKSYAWDTAALYAKLHHEAKARVAELERDAERYQFWRNRWGDEQFLSTLAGTIRQLSDPLIRGDYNNLDIVSDAAIAASKEIPR